MKNGELIWYDFTTYYDSKGVFGERVTTQKECSRIASSSTARLSDSFRRGKCAAKLRHTRSTMRRMGPVPVNIWRQFDLHESRLKSPRGVRGRKRLTEAPSSPWLFDPFTHHRAYTSPDSWKIYIDTQCECWSGRVILSREYRYIL